ncbi:hypothetical protein XIS1_370005 [Xenorhabdus innexi]|uniref:Uncharacterized protein n=1 Tax=Xenorhabdus innexi TaxID=290109 RepID=A0A1N6MXG4_9GAMM|nr:hypothetical protein XIS1_370005 [Xenorhabdus innexi]
MSRLDYKFEQNKIPAFALFLLALMTAN